MWILSLLSDSGSGGSLSQLGSKFNSLIFFSLITGRVYLNLVSAQWLIVKNMQVLCNFSVARSF
jgi:hypothetical protein